MCENTDHQGNFSAANDVTHTTETFGEYEVLAVDLDGDGDLDLQAVFNNSDTIKRYENLCLNSIPPPTMAPTPSPVNERAPIVRLYSFPTLSPTSRDDTTDAMCRVSTNVVVCMTPSL